MINQVTISGTMLTDPKIYGDGKVLKGLVKINTDIIPIIGFGTMVDKLESLSKGDQITISGHLQSGKYMKDGKTVYTLDVVVTEIK